jgi:hypothetical protein
VSDLDVEELRDIGAPDYKVASLALWISQGSDFARRVGLDYETLTSVSMIAHEIYRAISVRGARVGELVEALRKVRPKGSIARDLPSTRKSARQGNE